MTRVREAGAAEPTRLLRGLASSLCLVAFGPTALAEPSEAPTAPIAFKRIVIDPVTGRARLPLPEEVEAAKAAAPAAAARSAAPAAAKRSNALADHPAMRRMPEAAPTASFGATVRRVDPSRLSFSIVRLGADGRPHLNCVAGEDPALHALHAPVEGGRDDR